MKNITNRLVLVLLNIVISISLFSVTSSNVLPFNYTAYRTETALVIDGIGNEECWKSATWALINQPFDGKATIPDSADFYGRYKVAWDASKIYVLMEITDDKLVDNRANPTNAYWDDDCAEFFIDEDNSPQGHECGANAFNAFAYHIAAVARDKRNYTNGSILSFDSPNAINHVIDLGYDCNTNNAINLNEHVKVKIVKDGNKYTWELEFKIFNKNYNQHSSNNVPVVLTANKVMGFAIAYCDNDSGVRDNMIGTIPNHNDYGGSYPFYRYTNDFGTLTLNDSVLISSIVALNSINVLNYDLFYPNPVKNILIIKTDNSNKQFDQIVIVNLAGVEILSDRIENDNAMIDVSFLSSGVYVAKVSIGEHSYKQLFIKE